MNDTTPEDPTSDTESTTGATPPGNAMQNIQERLTYRGFKLTADGSMAECPSIKHPKDDECNVGGELLELYETDLGVSLECPDRCTEEDIIEGLGLSMHHLKDATWETSASPKAGPVIFPPPNAPLEVARILLQAFHHPDGSAFRYRCGTPVTWTGFKWAPMEETKLRRGIYETLEYAKYVKVDGRTGVETLTPWNPAKPTVDKILDAMLTVQHIPEEVESPSWLGTGSETPPGTFISCENGLLRLEDRQMAEHTPKFFTFTTLPFGYDPEAPEPTNWMRFLEQILEHDPDAIHTVQELVGYIVSGRTDLHKIGMIVGPPRAGKGTFFRILTDLIGKENVSAPTIESLKKPFGLQGLITSSLAIIGDAGLDGNARGVAQIVERLKTISGGDTVSVERKHLPDWVGTLPTRFIVGANAIPKLPDASGAMANRFVIIELRKSFLGREDLGLEGRLRTELPGIFNWALEGLQRLNENGCFTISRMSREATSDMADLGSPVAAFVRQMCEVAPEAKISKQELFNCWEAWRTEEGHQHIDSATFGTDLKSAEASITNKSKVTLSDGSRANAFSGIRLRSDAGERMSRVSFDDPNFWRIMAERHATEESGSERDRSDS